jgi:predicted small secreted protein
MLQKILATLLLLGALAGCNTMNGFGQDVERGGEKIQEKATRLSETFLEQSKRRRGEGVPLIARASICSCARQCRAARS